MDVPDGAAGRIERDRARFAAIVRGHIKRDLRRYVTGSELLGRQGRQLVSIPVPRVELPRFRFGRNGGGQGQGRGEPAGEDGQPAEGQGAGAAGSQPGRHLLEVELSLDDLARLLGEELELPDIQPRGRARVAAPARRFTSLRRAGPRGLRHMRRSFREALRRELASGRFDPARPGVVPLPDDLRYRAWKDVPRPEHAALVLYMMDVSGSMGREQKEIVRLVSFWIDTWLRSQYRSLEMRYVVHDAVAREVDQDTFYRLRESGGTKISSAYALAAELIETRFPPAEWNAYLFHFSDGDNWSGRDTERCLAVLRERLLPGANLFCYGQVKSAYGSGQFKKDVDAALGGDERVITAEILDREGILPAIRQFLGRGR